MPEIYEFLREMRLIIGGLLVLCAGIAQSSLADPARFAPGAISVNGRATLSPGFSPDGMTAYFTQSECASIPRCPQHLYVSRLEDGTWTRGERIEKLGNYRVDWPSVTPDGRQLILTWTAPRTKYKDLDIITNFDLYRLDLDEAAAMPVPFEGSDINRPRAGKLKTRRAFHVQSAGIITLAGDLYFWDEREDAVGERDVFIAPGDGKGGFEAARPLPAPINSTGRDHHSWVSPGGGLMFVSYPDRGGLGEDDIFVSRKGNDGWSKPVSLGPLVNSPYPDFAARLTPDGLQLVFTSSRPFGDRGPGLYQVWSVATSDLIETGVLTNEDLDR
ncbi:MAG: hypothetical protein HKN59_05730 [Gammaproteobacteria bacterium]|nr:hypothetical protein [Gammaproteobacteria bacterium]